MRFLSPKDNNESITTPMTMPRKKIKIETESDMENINEKEINS